MFPVNRYETISLITMAYHKDHTIGWLRKGSSSLGGSTMVRFSQIEMVSGECRITSIGEKNKWVQQWSVRGTILLRYDM